MQPFVIYFVDVYISNIGCNTSYFGGFTWFYAVHPGKFGYSTAYYSAAVSFIILIDSLFTVV
jgi:hypothetical protein